MSDLVLRRVRGDDLTAAELHAVLRLRAEVFVVEQDCAYLDPDGHDLEASTAHLWLEGAGGQVASYLRVLPEPGGGARIGRVVTSPQHRGHGLAGQLLDAALDGEEFLDDGIPHTPMRLA